LVINATRSSGEIANSVTLIPGSRLVENFQNLISSKSISILAGFKNSFIITVGATVLSILFSCLTAYGLFVYNFKLRGPAFTFIVAVLMVPTQVSAVGFVRFMVEIGFYNTYWPLIIPAAAAPAVVFFIRQFMKSSFPLDIVEAARIDGSSEFRTFLTIGLPMLKPAIAVQTIFAFIANWNNFFMPNMLIVSIDKKTLPMMIASLNSDRYTDHGMVYMGIALSIVPLLIIYGILGKFIVENIAIGGVKE
jgi:multiple sugar transport system permease protein